MPIFEHQRQEKRFDLERRQDLARNENAGAHRIWVKFGWDEPQNSKNGDMCEHLQPHANDAMWKFWLT